MKQLVEWMNDPELTQWLGPRFPISLEEQEAWYGKLIQDDTKKKLMIEDQEGTAIGLVSLMQLDWRNRQAEIGLYVGRREYIGKGYGTDAILTMLRFAFQELGLHRIYGRTFQQNTRALRMVAKCGFEQEGELRDAVFFGGRFHNQVLLSVLADEFSESGATEDLGSD